jgi:metal-responsive CopG/Arc/MetJ family transcriptional regulator
LPLVGKEGLEFGIDFGITSCHNGNMKTAISIPDEIFREIERFSKEHQYSRSEVFVMAAKEFLDKLKSKELLKTLNEVYSEPESSEEITLREKSKSYYSKKILKKNR